MARHDPHDHARREGTTRKGDDDGLPGHRPHGRLAPHRPPGGRDDPQALPDVRPPSAGPHRRRHGHDRRPERQVAGAQPARRGDAAPQPGGDQAPAGQAARLRFGRAERRASGEQLRLDEGVLVPRLHPRHRQVHHRQLHDGQGFGQEALQRRGRRHVVHRVHLPARAGLRLPAPLRDDELQDPAGRRRPVGQHHHRHRAHPPQAGLRGRGLRHHLPAHHQGRRHQVRQDRERQRVARPALYVALQVLSVLAQRQRCSTARRSRRSWRSTGRHPTCARCRSAWPRRSPV